MAPWGPLARLFLHSYPCTPLLYAFHLCLNHTQCYASSTSGVQRNRLTRKVSAAECPRTNSHSRPGPLPFAFASTKNEGRRKKEKEEAAAGGHDWSPISLRGGVRQHTVGVTRAAFVTATAVLLLQ